MRVLITNQSLAVRAGTEARVRDWARGLQQLGHLVMVYSSDLSRGPRLLERDLIPVTTNLENLSVQPDIIHAQHHLDAMSALAALPGVPAIYHEHGGVWQGHPLVHPRLYHYLAASQPLREGLLAHDGLSLSNVSLFLHSVDASRFLQIRKLPAAPRRALFVNHHHAPDSIVLQELRQAALGCGLHLEFSGREFASGGQGVEEILPRYDLVFAFGQTALEALACGCAVVVTAPHGLGEMVTLENLDRLRQANFSLAPASAARSFADLATVVGNYSASAGEAIATQVRQQAEFTASLTQLLEIYRKVIEQHQGTTADLAAEQAAMTQYLRNLTPGIMEANTYLQGRWPLSVSWQPFSLTLPRDPAPIR